MKFASFLGLCVLFGMGCVEVQVIIDGKKGEGESVCDVSMRTHIKPSGLHLTSGFVLFLKVGKSYLDSFGCKLGLIKQL